MSDFPNPLGPGIGGDGILSPWNDTTWSQYGLQAANNYVNTATVWTANRAVFQPVLVPRTIIVYLLSIRVQTQAGNVDVGIYDLGDNRLVSSGTTAVAAAGIQTFDITDTTLTPGWYKLALSSDSATAVFRTTVNLTVANARLCGFQQQSSAFVLPATATPVAYATACAPMIAGSYRAVF